MKQENDSSKKKLRDDQRQAYIDIASADPDMVKNALGSNKYT